MRGIDKIHTAPARSFRCARGRCIIKNISLSYCELKPPMKLSVSS